jgi:hypothetical protein
VSGYVGDWPDSSPRVIPTTCPTRMTQCAHQGYENHACRSKRKCTVAITAHQSSHCSDCTTHTADSSNIPFICPTRMAQCAHQGYEKHAFRSKRKCTVAISHQSSHCMHSTHALDQATHRTSFLTSAGQLPRSPDHHSFLSPLLATT